MKQKPAIMRICDASCLPAPPSWKGALGVRLLLELTYGAGLRVSEVVRLRVKDLDFDNRLVFVRGGKGDTALHVHLLRLSRHPFRGETPAKDIIRICVSCLGGTI